MRRMEDQEIIICWACILWLFIVGLSGCRMNYYSIKTEYENPVTSGEKRYIEAKIEGHGTIRQITNVYEKVFKFVNDELMYKRK